MPGLSYLKMICEGIPNVEVVRAFNDPVKFLKESKEIDFDFCILDIEMPGLNGLQVAQLLPGKPVIFTTAYKEYAAEAYDLDIVDYVRKPIQKERLEKAVQKVVNKIRPKEKQFVQVNSQKGKTLLFFDQLLLISTSDADKRDKIAILQNGDRLLLKNITLARMLALLPSADFCQVNKKEIVAIRAVSYSSHDEITTVITDDEGQFLQLTLGETYKKDFVDKLAK